jgi:hypothetical protein
MKDVIARNEAISPFQSWQTEKREIASQARNDKIWAALTKTGKERLLRRLAMTKKLGCAYKDRKREIASFLAMTD